MSSWANYDYFHNLCLYLEKQKIYKCTPLAYNNMVLGLLTDSQEADI